MASVLVFLDLDDVVLADDLAAVRSAGLDAAEAEHFTVCETSSGLRVSVKVVIPAEVREFLRSFDRFRVDDVRLVLASSWVSHPKLLSKLVSRLGLVADVVEASLLGFSDSPGCGKRDAVEHYMDCGGARFVGDDGLVVWVDDQLIADDYAGLVDGGFQVFPVSPRHGVLTQKEMDDVLAACSNSGQLGV